MIYLPISQIPMIEEEEATGEVAQIYDEMKRELEVPFISNLAKTLAGSLSALAPYWALVRTFYQHSILPHSLTSMILFSIAAAKDCRYCSASHQVTCRTLGVDEATLEAMVKDLEAVSPQRIQEIINFALKCALDPLSLVEEDYERVRAQGVSDEELVEIVSVAAAGNYLDTLADGLKIEIDSQLRQALHRG
jgi:uncharacterized peroxidase-related enzyme